MRVLSIFAFLCLGAVWAQTPQPQTTMPDLPDETVVAVFDDGVKFTFGDFKRVYAALPPDAQKMALVDRHNFLQQWALMRKLAKMAEEIKLDQQSPIREQLEYNRLFLLMNAKLNSQLVATEVQPEEIVNYYNDHKEDYKQVHLRAIYIKFGDKVTEAQAKAKADKVLTQLRGGADFVKLVKEYSEDETSRGRDGDFLTLHPGDNVPDALRTTVFKLKQGEISEVVKQTNGFYIFRADEVSYRPLSQVREAIFTAIKEQHYKEWLDKVNKDLKIQLTNPQFLGLVPAIPGSK